MIRCSAHTPVVGLVSRLDDQPMSVVAKAVHDALGPVSQTGPQAFSCTSSHWVQDFEGLFKEIPAGVPPVEGARVVTNMLEDADSFDNATYWMGINGAVYDPETRIMTGYADNDGWRCQTGNLPAGEVGRRYRATWDIELLDETSSQLELTFWGDAAKSYSASIHTVPVGERVRITNYCEITAAGSLTTNLRLQGAPTGPTRVRLYRVLFEEITGQSNQNPSEWVPPGTTYFNYENGNTVDVNGIVTEAKGPRISAGTIKGVRDEKSSTNKCTAYTANPTDTTNINKGGDAAATLTVVDDSAELAAAGLSRICANGQVFKLDNSGGVSDAWATTVGEAGTLNPHTLSAYVRGEGDIRFGGMAGQLTFNTPTYQRVVNTLTPDVTSRHLQILCKAGQVAYFILQQLEESEYATSLIPVAGASVTRAATQRHMDKRNARENDFWVVLAVRVPFDPAGLSDAWFPLWGSNDTVSDSRCHIYLNGTTGLPTIQRKVNGVSTTISIPISFTYSPNDLLVIAGRWSRTNGLTVWAKNVTTQSEIARNDRTDSVTKDDVALDTFGFGAAYASTADHSVNWAHFSIHCGDAPDSVIEAEIERLAGVLL